MLNFVSIKQSLNDWLWLLMLFYTFHFPLATSGVWTANDVFYT